MTNQAFALDNLPMPAFTDNRFHTAINPLEMSEGSTLSTGIKFLFERNNRTPAIRLPSQPVDLAPFSRREAGTFNSTWIGHSSLMINMDGFRILLDPVFEEKVTIVGPKRFNGPLPVDLSNLPDIDLVIVSHDHYDHLNKATIKALKDKAACFMVPLGVDAHLKNWGIPASRIIALNWWQSGTPVEGLTVTATPGQHFSGRGLMDRNRTLWASWVIASPNYKIFFSGDSGYFDGFAAIGKAFGPFDMTFLECGAYDPAWHGVHMYPEETVQAHRDLKGEILHPIHWGTFNLALHPWYDPMERLLKAAKTAGVTIATPMAGQTVTLTELGTPWWEIHKTITVAQ
ncbi:MAG: MBL fold metallo-hydrolase [Desulfobacterales bacterium]|nr:MBL fold metallo-hydrolase [Desulfobacterales bacterium]